ncbi:sensor histidine kinase [Chryseobacterium sp. KACC 21268]|nr:sensor histidine kinase [Chryseobacterium sp. KACC 21268]
MKEILDQKLRKEIGYQIVFWIALLLFGMVTNYGEHDNPDFKEIFFYDLCHWIFQIIGANFIYFILIRKYFESKKYLLFAIYFIISMYVLGVLNRMFIVHIAEPFFLIEPKNSMVEILTDVKYLLFHYNLPIISGSFIFISVMFILRYKNEKQNTLQLQKEKSELELKALKSQLNPHFLFNTLNNIYSLSIANSNETSQSISRLSDILDYILYKGQKEVVSISEELKIIDDYIELEKLRYDERLKLIKNKEIKFPAFIPPLLYLSFVENAFKHGAEKTIGTAEIKISLETKAEFSIFKVENQYFEKKTDEKVGIGLQNIKKQLDLYYRNQYSLEIKKDNNWFMIKLMTPRQ